MDATKINRQQFSTLISQGVGVVSSTSAETWAERKLDELRIPKDRSDVKLYATEETMIESLRYGEINHVIAYKIRFPYYKQLIGDNLTYRPSFVIDSQTPIAFIFGSDFSQQLRLLVNSELAALNHDGTIANIEKYWINSLN